MSGEWLKMRTSLLSNPKLHTIAKLLESSPFVCQALGKNVTGVMSDFITRDVMRYVTFSSLAVIWGAANEHTLDGTFENCDLSYIDELCKIPGFGAAMASVGWVTFDEISNSVAFPNFYEYNTTSSERSAEAKTGAARQREYRERMMQKIDKKNKSDESDANSDGESDELSDESDVTRNRREEKRREEKRRSKPKIKNIIASTDLFLGINENIAKDFRELRSRKKAPITPTAINGIRREATKAGISLEDALRICCERGWVGFKSEWILQNGRAPPLSAAEKRKEWADGITGKNNGQQSIIDLN